jgi:hypothetical protein
MGLFQKKTLKSQNPKTDIQTNKQKNTRKKLTILVIKEMKTQTMLRFYFTPVIMAIIRNTNNNKCWQRCGEKGMVIHCWWDCKLVQLL